VVDINIACRGIPTTILIFSKLQRHRLIITTVRVMTTDETTPLLRDRVAHGKDARDQGRWARIAAAIKRGFPVERRILLTGFLITLSFSFTQVP
jgi:hypothetical protein